MKRTVCQLLHSLEIGGAEVLASRLSRALAHRFRFVFACLDEIGEIGDRLQHDGYLVAHLHRQPGVDFGCIGRLARFLDEERADLIHAYHYTPFFYAAAARGFRRRWPILYAEHARPVLDRPRPKRLLFNRCAFQSVDRVVAVGECMRDALIKNEKITRRIDVIYNGVDVTPASSQHARAEVRAELNLGANDFVIIQVARLDPVKDHLTAIETMRRLTAVRDDIRLLLVGDGPERQRVHDAISAHRLDAQIRVLGVRHDVTRLLQAADAFLLTSIAEAIPVSILEAMSTALPVVATAVGGVPEVVIDGSTGLLAPAGDAAALCAAIQQLTSDESRRRQLGACGAERARSAFSQAQMISRYQQCYEAMLEPQRSRARVPDTGG
jgi:glycosyltransferase involved in cell wall biosynthesis